MALSACEGFYQYIGYHHIIMITIIISIIFSSILVAGCTASSLSNVYLLSLSYATNISSPPQNDQTQVNPNVSITFASLVGTNAPASVEVRAGYLGLCMKESSGLWVCAPSAETLANAVKDSRTDGDPLNLIWIAKNFKSQLIFDGLIFTSIPLEFICLLLLFTFPSWHTEEDEDGSEQEVKPFPSKSITNAALAVVTVASILTFISAYGQHISSSTAGVLAQSLSYETVESHVGTVAMILGWGAVLLELLAAIALLIMILSIRLLMQQLEE